MNTRVRKILLEDWEQKKSYEANWVSTCSVAHETIEEGDTFYFYGDKKKICSHCYGEVIDELEESGVAIAPKKKVALTFTPMPVSEVPVRKGVSPSEALALSRSNPQPSIKKEEEQVEIPIPDDLPF